MGNIIKPKALREQATLDLGKSITTNAADLSRASWAAVVRSKRREARNSLICITEQCQQQQQQQQHQLQQQESFLPSNWKTPANPYLLFFLRLRHLRPDIRVTKLAQVAGQRWRDMNPSQREKYIKLAAAAKRRREIEKTTLVSNSSPRRSTRLRRCRPGKHYRYLRRSKGAKSEYRKGVEQQG